MEVSMTKMESKPKNAAFIRVLGTEHFRAIPNEDGYILTCVDVASGQDVYIDMAFGTVEEAKAAMHVLEKGYRLGVDAMVKTVEQNLPKWLSREQYDLSSGSKKAEPMLRVKNSG